MVVERITARTIKRFQDQLPHSADVVIIGGGVIGVFASLYLKTLGKKVVVVEKGTGHLSSFDVSNLLECL